MVDSTRDDAWLVAQVATFAQERPHWVSYARWCAGVLDAAARRAGIAVMVQSRAKTVASFAEKAIRKRHKYDDPVHQLTDLCGVRVIVSSLEDLAPICDFVEAHFVIDPDNSLDQRSVLRPREFGYRSVHYVVSPPSNDDVPPEIRSRKAEIQIRTILQHAWADIGHDRLYKRQFRIPESWDRDAARIAAMLEEADEMFGRMIRQVDPYHTFAARAIVGSSADAENELRLLQTTFEHCGTPPPRDLLARIAQLALALERDELILQLLDGPDAVLDPRVLYCRGQARCRRHAESHDDPVYIAGLDDLRAASQQLSYDAGAHLAYAEAARTVDPAGSQEAIETAYRVDPADPQVLVEIVRLRIRLLQQSDLLGLVAPSIRAAITTARSLIAADINSCQNGLAAAELLGLVGDYTASFETALDALALVPGGRLLRASAQVWAVYEETARDDYAAQHWCTMRQLVGLVSNSQFPQAGQPGDATAVAASAAAAPTPPIVILAGANREAAARVSPDERSLLQRALAGFRGTLIAGERQPNPARLAEGLWDADFPMEPCALSAAIVDGWVRRTAVGVEPQRVRVLGAAGGQSGRWECQLGLLLGAEVAALPSAARDFTSADPPLRWAKDLVRLPADPATIAIFCSRAAANLLPEDQRLAIARAIHADYCQRRTQQVALADPAMRDWDHLSPELRNSNLAQADDIGLKLRAMGLMALPVSGRAIRLYEFSAPQVEQLAELEHARWNLERLQSGWRYASERDVDRKRSPYLVPWSELSEEIKQFDREAVRKIPQSLRDAGYEITPAG